MAGRPQKPVAHRADNRPQRMQGVTRLEVDPDREPTIPPCPPTLGGHRVEELTREAWESFRRSAVSELVDFAADGYALLRWIRAVNAIERLAPTLARSGMRMGSMGQQVVDPVYRILAQHEKTVAYAEGRFGMTPSARSRMRLTFRRAEAVEAGVAEAARQATDPAPMPAEIPDARGVDQAGVDFTPPRPRRPQPGPARHRLVTG